MVDCTNRHRLTSLLSSARILITGGLGMIGSSVAHRLVIHGAQVTIADALIKPYGANFFNLEGIRDKLEVTDADIRDKEAFKYLVKDKDIIFNFAAQVSHNDSLLNPFLDTEINYIGHLNILEAMRRVNPTARIIFSGSRLQFGRIESIPVKEDHPLRPMTPYALNKTAAEQMYMFYFRKFGISCTIFRIANPYGARCQMKHSKYSIVNYFIRQAMEDKVITIFGNGEQLRDYIYIDDLTDALVLAAVSKDAAGEIFNVGSGVGTRFKDMVSTVIEVVGSGNVKNTPWPTDYVNIETGDYVTDISKITRVLRWSPNTSLKEGIERTHRYYIKFKQHYF